MNRAFPAKTPGIRENFMSRRCELTGKGTQVGHNVSHANNKTKRIYRPNLQTIDLASEALGNSYKLRIATNTLRSVDKMGGLDPFLLQAKDGVLSPRALRLRRAIAKKVAAQA
jgi:large subunit ribosomal protein L28